MGAKFWHRLGFEQELWRKGTLYVAGVDEAGCGPLAGPVIAGAVLFPCSWLETGLYGRLRGLNDSKQLTEEQREQYYAILTTHPEIRWAIASVEVELIDQLNILQAAHRAMNLALEQLRPAPQHVLVDGRPVKSLRFPHTPLVKGDCKSYSIAAASVLAKVTRDRLMVDMDGRYPGYGFANHKGYSTPEHLAAIQKLGPCAIHRRSFSPFQPTEMELFSNAADASGVASFPAVASQADPAGVSVTALE
jgi:ribonuclease HII